MIERLNSNKIRGHTLRIEFGVIILALLLAGSAGATTWQVGPGHTFSTIQNAINHYSVMPGDIIEVHFSPTPYEKFNVNKKNLILRGIGMPVVSGAGSDTITLSVDGITLEGFIVNSGGLAGITVLSDNNTLSGNLVKDNYGYGIYLKGIYLDSSSNNTLICNTIMDNQQGGIFMEYSSNNKVTDNTVLTTYYYENGIHLKLSDNNTLSLNQVNGHQKGIYLEYSSNNTLSLNHDYLNVNGIDLSFSNYNILDRNNASLNIGEGIYLADSVNNTLNGNRASNNINGISMELSDYNTLSWNEANSNSGAGIVISNSNDNKISNNRPFWNIVGISVDNSQRNLVETNVVNWNNNFGISLSSSSVNTLSGNNIRNSSYGINLIHSNSNTLHGNMAWKNYEGIYIESSNSNNLTDNGFYWNTGHGIVLYDLSDLNNISSNRVKHNTESGLYFFLSRYNIIYNNIFNNDLDINDFTSSNYNTWNTTMGDGTNIINGQYMGGNYWSKPDHTGFSETCNDNSYGICDENYTLSSGDIDYLPLTNDLTGVIGPWDVSTFEASPIAGPSCESCHPTNGNRLMDEYPFIRIEGTNISTHSDESGSYYLNVPDGRYNIIVSWEPEYYTNRSFNVTVGSNKTVVQDFELEKKPTGNISGTVATFCIICPPLP